MQRRHWVKLVLVFALWTLLGIFTAFRLMLSYAYSGSAIAWQPALRIALTDWYVWAALAPAIAWLARRFAIEQRSWPGSLLVHLPASLFFSILKMVLETQVQRRLNGASVVRNPGLELPSTLFI